LPANRSQPFKLPNKRIVWGCRAAEIVENPQVMVGISGLDRLRQVKEWGCRALLWQTLYASNNKTFTGSYLIVNWFVVRYDCKHFCDYFGL
jgi:hypothetical protein